MNEFLCNNCGQYSETKEDALKVCPQCGSDELAQSCPMCGAVIDLDTKVCPACREAVA